MSTPLVLVTNDDGINAPGLAALAEALAPLGDVYVVAPEREQSTVGHALTLHRPLRVDRLGGRRGAGHRAPPGPGDPGGVGGPPAGCTRRRWWRRRIRGGRRTTGSGPGRRCGMTGRPRTSSPSRTGTPR